MASTLRQGSTGSEVKKLQKLLNNAGYKLTVDGIFGANTLNAVKKYQQSKGLTVDGIVGANTWGKLTRGSGSSSSSSATTTPGTGGETTTITPPTATTPLGTTYNPETTTGNKADLSALEGKGPTFQQSQAYKDALAMLQQHQSAQPGAYQSGFQGRLDELYDKVMNRPGFKYDFNADQLYQQYKDQYMMGGQRAMQDTMAEAAALTGGYGNSYATAAGQQAYQQYLTGLNNVIPELQDAAYQRYRSEGQDVIDQLTLTQALDEMAYGRYRDQTNDYWTRLEYLTGLAGDQYNRDYQAYQDALSKYLADREYYYGKVQDDLAQENYLASQTKKSSGSSSGSKKNNPPPTDDPDDENDDPGPSNSITLREYSDALNEIMATTGSKDAVKEAAADIQANYQISGSDDKKNQALLYALESEETVKKKNPSKTTSKFSTTAKK